jgi:tetratricopeptide (TPR) repeat protein
LQTPPELKQRVEAGLNAKRAGDLDTAIREFKRVAELAPGLAASHVNLGAAYYEKKDYGNAIPPLRKALELNPELPGAHSMLGVALLAQGYAAESIPHLEKGQSDALLGVALLESGREREAMDRLEVALIKQPGDPDLLYYLSQAHARLSKQGVPGSSRAQSGLSADPSDAG